MKILAIFLVFVATSLPTYGQSKVLNTSTFTHSKEPAANQALSILLKASEQELSELAESTGISFENLKAAQEDLKKRIAKGAQLSELAVNGLCLNGICKPVEPNLENDEVSYKKIDEIKLLTQDFYTREQILADARSSTPRRRFALIVVKSHVCDKNEGHCLRVTQSLLDPYNTFVRDSFVVYHARVLRDNRLLSMMDESAAREEGTYDISDGMTGVPGIANVIREWPVDGMDKQIKVVDLSTGNIIGEIGIRSDLERIERLKSLKQDLLKINAVGETLGDKVDQIDSLQPSQCIEPECSIEFVVGALEDQYQREVADSSPDQRKETVERALNLLNSIRRLDNLPTLCPEETGKSCCSH